MHSTHMYSTHMRSTHTHVQHHHINKSTYHAVFIFIQYHRGVSFGRWRVFGEPICHLFHLITWVGMGMGMGVGGGGGVGEVLVCTMGVNRCWFCCCCCWSVHPQVGDGLSCVRVNICVCAYVDDWCKQETAAYHTSHTFTHTHTQTSNAAYNT